MGSLPRCLLPVLLCLTSALGLDNGLARTPPMGWSSWNKYQCEVTQKDIMSAADAMVSRGLKAAGYSFVNIDDCWMAKDRGVDGTLQPAPGQFTDMKALGDYIHKAGLRYGIYQSSGGMTCQQRAGSLLNDTCCEGRDAQSFAEWGVDYVKFDNCFAYPPWWPVNQPHNSTQRRMRYVRMRDAIARSGREMVYSICAPPNRLDEYVGDWARDVGNLWRVTGDIVPNFGNIEGMWRAADWRGRFAGPGGWNDLDMLEIGNAAMTSQQQRTHFGLWAVYKSPLILGADLDALTDTEISIVTSRGVIAVNQDPLGASPRCVRNIHGAGPLITGPLSGGRYVVAVANTQHGGATNVTVEWSDLGLAPTVRATVTDAWQAKDLGIFKGSVTIPVDADDTAILVVAPEAHPKGYPRHWLSDSDFPCYTPPSPPAPPAP